MVQVTSKSTKNCGNERPWQTHTHTHRHTHTHTYWRTDGAPPGSTYSVLKWLNIKIRVAQGWLENRNRTTEAPKTRSDVRMKSYVTLALIHKQLTVNRRLNVIPSTDNIESYHWPLSLWKVRQISFPWQVSFNLNIWQQHKSYCYLHKETLVCSKFEAQLMKILSLVCNLAFYSSIAQNKL